MSDENLERQRARLARSGAARGKLLSEGIREGTVQRFSLGLKAPYRPRGDAGVVENALSFPIFAADGARLSRFAFLNLEGVTGNPPHPEGWGVGTPLSYWSTVASSAVPLIVAPDVRTLWLLDQTLEGDDGPPLVLLCPSHGPDLPIEWSSERFWAGWPSITVLEGHGDQRDRLVDSVARNSRREIGRAGIGEGHGSWRAALRAGMSAADLRSRLAAAPSWRAEAEPDGVAEAELGDFGFAPVHVSSAFIDGNLYYPYLVEERTVEPCARRPGSRDTMVHRYSVRVLRSDGRVLRVRALPSSRGAPEDARVLALSDGTRIAAEPAVSRFASWSFSSIQGYIRSRQERAHALHRPLDLIAADVEAYLRGCVWLPRSDDFALAAAYVLTTFTYQVFEAVPLLLATGPKGSGKSEFAQALADLSCNGVVVGQASAAGLVRLMHETRGLLVIDDLERIGAGAGGAFGEIHQMLKVGYKRASGRKPVVDRAGNVQTLEFYGPKALTNTGGVEPILGSRCLEIAMSPLPDEVGSGTCLRGPDGVRAQELRDELHTWGMARAVDVQDAYRGVEARRRSRRDEIEAPLRAVAALVGSTFAARLDTALSRAAPDRVVETTVERVRRAVLACGHGGSVAIQHLQLELALDGRRADRLGPESIGRALVGCGFRSHEAATTRTRLNGLLCRIVELDLAPPSSNGAPAGPLDFCRMNDCPSCRYAAICPSVLPQLAEGKARAARRASGRSTPQVHSSVG